MEAEVPYRRSHPHGERGFVHDDKGCLYVVLNLDGPERPERPVTDLCIRCVRAGLANPRHANPHVTPQCIYAVENITDKDAITDIRYSCAMCSHHIVQEFRLCALCTSAYHLSGSGKTSIWHRILQPHVDECPLKRTNCTSKNARNKAIIPSP